MRTRELCICITKKFIIFITPITETQQIELDFRLIKHDDKQTFSTGVIKIKLILCDYIVIIVTHTRKKNRRYCGVFFSFYSRQAFQSFCSIQIKTTKNATACRNM